MGGLGDILRSPVATVATLGSSQLLAAGLDAAGIGKTPDNVAQANIDRTAFDPNQQEQGLTDSLIARANGQAPSAAEQTLQNGIGQAQRAGASAAASARGVNPALAARLAQQTQNNIATQGIGQTAAVRAQEQATATGQAAGVLGDQRAARGAREQLNVQNVTGANTISSNNQNASYARTGNFISGLGSAAAAASDENLKTDIRPGGAKIQDFLDHISAEEYRYKDPGYGQGSQVSPMAQDLEKSPLGSQMVKDTPQGKMVDYGKGMGAMLAAQAHLNERLNKIEGAQKMSSGGWAGYGSGVDEAVRGTKNMKVEEPKAWDIKSKESEEDEGNIAGGGGMGGGMGDGAMKSMAVKAFAFNDGAKVPGRAKVAGDHPDNDTVHAVLSPGELVIPRTVVQAGPDAIKKFAAALLEKEKSA